MPPITRNRKKLSHLHQPNSVSTTTILDLNEHCLLDIFRLVPTLDMCSVADTCKLFRDVAVVHMRKLYRSNELILSDQQDSGMKMLFKFGTAVTKLRVEFLNGHYHRTKAAFSLIRKFKPKLDSLTLALTDFDFNTALTLSPLLRNVRQFRIEYVINDSSCDIQYSSDIRSENTIKDLLKACANVEEFSFGAKMSVMGSRYQGIFLQQKLKRIRSLEICEVRDFDVNNLKIFLKLNPNVQRIALKRCVFLERFRGFDLSQYAPNIEAVALEFGENDHLLHANSISISMANVLGRLDKLKCLALDTCHTNVTDLIASIAKRNSLSNLSLTNVRHKINEGLCKAFTNMTNLKVLRLHVIFYFDDADFFKHLCKNLVHLEEFHSPQMAIAYEQIGDIIDNSGNLKKLYLPPFEEVANGSFNEETYNDFVRIRCRKNVQFPLTFYFQNDCFVIAMFCLRDCALNRDVINVSKYDVTDFDDYASRPIHKCK